MKHCTSCGSTIPDGQGNSCSMCYGDISHGSDGYYENWAREQMERQEREQWERDNQPEPDNE
ncbi:MAG: hypothetical protein ACYTBJ_22525 [Planctomycetota bacterium]